MPWSGSGVYTRAYASWTADASNNLPISATKFDTEDNDFAAGIQNCLTIDNQNKPNTTLTWAQTLNLTKGTDANVFSISRTGGTNNPALTWSLQDAADTVTAQLATGNAAFVLKPTLYTIGNAVDAPNFLFAGNGFMTVGGGTTTSTAVVSIANVGGAAHLSLTDSAATTNQKIWDFYADSAGTLHARLVNDANNATTDWLSVTRTGFASTITSFPNTAVQISDGTAGLFAAGYLGLPQNSQAANYTTILPDRAKQIYHSSASPHTFTIAANASVAYTIGDVLHFVNPPGGGSLTIAINTDTLTLVPTGTTGSRTLLAPGVATAEKIAAGSWIIYGSNLS